jgi:hypothetical protein
MQTARADTSDRYEKIDENVLRLKPIGRRPRRRILTPFGRKVIFGMAIVMAVITILFMNH